MTERSRRNCRLRSDNGASNELNRGIAARAIIFCDFLPTTIFRGACALNRI